MKKRTQKRLPAIHPGEILREDFMLSLGLTMNQLGLDIRVPVTRIAAIFHERRSITADTALRLGLYFKTSPEFWLNLQSAYDLEVAKDKLLPRIEGQIQNSVQRRTA